MSAAAGNIDLVGQRRTFVLTLPHYALCLQAREGHGRFRSGTRAATTGEPATIHSQIDIIDAQAVPDCNSLTRRIHRKCERGSLASFLPVMVAMTQEVAFIISSATCTPGCGGVISPLRMTAMPLSFLEQRRGDTWSSHLFGGSQGHRLRRPAAGIASRASLLGTGRPMSTPERRQQRSDDRCVHDCSLISAQAESAVIPHSNALACRHRVLRKCERGRMVLAFRR